MKIIRITREYTSDASEAEIARATLAYIQNIPFNFTTAIDIWQQGTVSKSNCCAAVYDLEKKEVRTVDLSYWLNHIQQLEYETVINCEIGQGIFSSAINDEITNKATYYLIKKNPGIAKGNYRIIAYVVRGDGEIADNCELMKAVAEFYGELKAAAKPEPMLEPAELELDTEPEPAPEHGNIWATADREELAKRLAEQLAQDDKIQAATLNKILAGKNDGCGHIFAFLDKVGIIKYIPRQRISIEFAALILTFAKRASDNAEKSKAIAAKDTFCNDIVRYYHETRARTRPEPEPEPELEAKLYISTSELAKRLNIDVKGVRMFCYSNVFRYHKSPGKAKHTRFSEDEANYNMKIWRKIQKNGRQNNAL